MVYFIRVDSDTGPHGLSCQSGLIGPHGLSCQSRLIGLHDLACQRGLWYWAKRSLMSAWTLILGHIISHVSVDSDIGPHDLACQRGLWYWATWSIMSVWTLISGHTIYDVSVTSDIVPYAQSVEWVWSLVSSYALSRFSVNSDIGPHALSLHSWVSGNYMVSRTRVNEQADFHRKIVWLYENDSGDDDGFQHGTNNNNK